MGIYSGSRTPSWQYLLLDEDDNPIGDLTDGVDSASFDVDAGSRLGGSGSIRLDTRGVVVDWMKHRVQAVYDMGRDDVVSWPVATMLLSYPTENHGAAGETLYDVSLLSKCALLDEDAVEDFYGVDAGENPVDAAIALIQGVGESKITATSTDVVLAKAMSWEPGASKLTIINDLLEAAGYRPLWCDGAGFFRVELWEAPTARDVDYEFESGEASIHSPEWSRSQDLSSVPNRFLAIGRGDGDAAGLVGEARNEDPSSEFSYQARGNRWITRTETGVEAASQAEFDAIALKLLYEAVAPVASLTVKHFLIPLEPNDLVVFSPLSGDTRMATVQTMKIGTGLDAWVEATWREVVFHG